MKLSAFIKLSAENKRSTIMTQGVPIAKWDNFSCRVFLFQLSHFYVETYCNKKSKDIQEFRVLHSPDQLDHYLNTIPIDELLN